MELSLLRHGEGRLVPQFSLHDEVREGRLFPWAQFSPMPPGASKQPDVRYLDIYEADELDEAQLLDWIKQASELPGERM